MATKKNVTKNATEGKPATPAQVLRKQKAAIEEACKVAPPSMPTGRHPASDAAEAMGKAKKTIADMSIPMTLGEICKVMGVNCEPDNFAASALGDLAAQLYAVSHLAEVDRDHSRYEGWQVVENIVARMKLASEVVTWLESDTTELPAEAQS